MWWHSDRICLLNYSHIALQSSNFIMSLSSDSRSLLKQSFNSTRKKGTALKENNVKLHYWDKWCHSWGRLPACSCWYISVYSNWSSVIGEDMRTRSLLSCCPSHLCPPLCSLSIQIRISTKIDVFSHRLTWPLLITIAALSSLARFCSIQALVAFGWRSHLMAAMYYIMKRLNWKWGIPQNSCRQMGKASCESAEGDRGEDICCDFMCILERRGWFWLFVTLNASQICHRCDDEFEIVVWAVLNL